jgi:hypothetical protein
LGVFQKSIGQSTFPVVDMCDNTKIPNMFHLFDLWRKDTKILMKFLLI